MIKSLHQQKSTTHPRLPETIPKHKLYQSTQSNNKKTTRRIYSNVAKRAYIISAKILTIKRYINLSASF